VKHKCSFIIFIHYGINTNSNKLYVYICVILHILQNENIKINHFYSILKYFSICFSLGTQHPPLTRHVLNKLCKHQPNQIYYAFPL